MNEAALGVFLQPTRVQHCSLRETWKGVTKMNFTVDSSPAVNLGLMTGPLNIGNVDMIIDSFVFSGNEFAS